MSIFSHALFAQYLRHKRDTSMKGTSSSLGFFGIIHPGHAPETLVIRSRYLLNSAGQVEGGIR
ncbi:predicted protein [Plenodomus lingam JN3]|uniref:Predicted protein n=1 Tax=Leptosphaeria maculans (strain JN3 / isolate v23.1.3 / race Av1-4-5-6-7-8) TaxID=985895 RepID=E5AE18_LEPMJ|nr:predicted protein [Plenodomus lingam JN3]CBY01457.1 predicted protein [Plenodomus lingam JN3]